MFVISGRSYLCDVCSRVSDQFGFDSMFVIFVQWGGSGNASSIFI